MRLEYHRVDYPNGETRYFPLIFLDIIVPGCPRYPTSALVDSGAETSLFSRTILEELDIDYEYAQTGDARGADGRLFPVIDMPVRASMLGKTIHLQTHWTSSRGYFNLLGRSDFFTAFKVSFNERQHYMEIEAY